MDRESKSLHKSWTKWARTPPTQAKNSKNTELNGSGGEEERGYKPGLFVPVGATNRDQIPSICPCWWLHPGPSDGATNRDKRPLPISLFFLPRPSRSAQCACYSCLGWGEFLPISSIICEVSLISCPFNSYKC